MKPIFVICPDKVQANALAVNIDMILREYYKDGTLMLPVESNLADSQHEDGNPLLIAIGPGSMNSTRVMIGTTEHADEGRTYYGYRYVDMEHQYYAGLDVPRIIDRIIISSTDPRNINFLVLVEDSDDMSYVINRVQDAVRAGNVTVREQYHDESYMFHVVEAKMNIRVCPIIDKSITDSIPTLNLSCPIFVIPKDACNDNQILLATTGIISEKISRSLRSDPAAGL